MCQYVSPVDQINFFLYLKLHRGIAMEDMHTDDRHTAKNLGITAMVFLFITLALVIIANVVG